MSRPRRLCLHLVLLATMTILLAAPASAQGQLFWSVAGFGDDEPALVRSGPEGAQPDAFISTVPFSSIQVDPVENLIFGRSPDGVLRRANLDGSGLQDLGGVTDVRMLMVDAGAGHVYWLDQDERIRRANRDGTTIVTVVAEGASPFRLDLANGFLFWRDVPTNTFRRANLDGSGVVDLHTLGEGVSASCPVVDPVNQQFYWNDFLSGVTSRVNYDGSGYEEVDVDGCMAPIPADGMLYWRATGGGVATIRRAHPDGSGREDLAAVTPYANNLVIDDASGTMYWSTDNLVERANVDGSARETVMEGFAPSSLTVSPEEDRLFVMGGSTMHVARRDGSDARILFSGVRRPGALAVDADAGRVFWVDQAEQRIATTRLTGDNFHLIAQVTSAGPGSLALDPVEQQIYWISDAREILRANYDGSGQEVVPLDNARADAIAIDPEARALYWAQGISLQRAGLDGSGQETVLTEIEVARAITLDVDGQRVYWASNAFVMGNTQGQIHSVSFDGTDARVEVDGLPDIQALTMDVEGRMLYWSTEEETIERASLDALGAGSETIVTGVTALGLAFAATSATSVEHGQRRASFRLAAYPNPADRAATLALTVPVSGAVRVALYDMLGRRVALLHDGPLANGPHLLEFDVSRFPPGLYVVRADGPTGVASHRMTVVR